MSLSAASELGRALGTMSAEQEQIKSQISEDEATNLAVNYNEHQLKVSGGVVVKKKVLRDDTLIINHIVYGFIDDTSLFMDGEYDTADPDHDEVLSTETL